MDLTERLLCLRSLPAGPQLRSEHLLTLATRAQERAFRAGAPLFRQDDPVTRILFVLRGRALLAQGDLLLGTVDAPGALGVRPLLAGMEMPYSVRAATELLTLELDAGTYIELLEDDFDAWLVLLRFTFSTILDRYREEPARVGAARPLIDGQKGKPPGLVERILLLRRSALFGTSSVNALAELAQRFETVEVPEGQVIYRDGDPADALYLLLDGQLTFQPPQGPAVTLDPGVPFGAPDALADQPRWGAVTAARQSLLFRVKIEALLDVLEDNTEMAMDYLRRACRWLLEQDLSQRRSERIAAPQQALSPFGFPVRAAVGAAR